MKSFKKEVCKLLESTSVINKTPEQIEDAPEFKTTQEVIDTSSKIKDVPALFKPAKLLGDYTVSAGFIGTPELTQNYLNSVPGQSTVKLWNEETLNNIVKTFLKEQNMSTPAAETLQPNPTCCGGMQQAPTLPTPMAFNDFSGEPSLEDELNAINRRAFTPVVVTMGSRGNAEVRSLAGAYGDTPPSATTTVDPQLASQDLLKKMASIATMISSAHGYNQPTKFNLGA